ncbi:MAG TPA: glycosyltransferase family 2 protein [bacterium]|nr:glycosyltransferase family 2 protein [bacterium]
MAPRVTVVVVSYDTRDDLVRCLDHLARQDEPVEVIVFDNGSRDGSANVARRTGVRLFASPANQGYAAATNQAVRKARGRLILLLNPDAFLPTDGARRLADLLEDDPSLGGVAPQLVGEDGRVQRTCRRLPKTWDLLCELTGLSRMFPRSGLFNRWKMGDTDHAEERRVEQVYASCWMLRKDEFNALGGFDTRFPIFFNDVDLARRLVRAGRLTLYYPQVKVIHRGGTSVKKIRARSVLWSHRAFYRYLKENGPRFNPLLWLLTLPLAVAAPLRVLWREVC